jgi:hypothetical protein
MLVAIGLSTPADGSTCGAIGLTVAIGISGERDGSTRGATCDGEGSLVEEYGTVLD